MSTLCKIENSVLNWAVAASGFDVQTLTEKFPELPRWLQDTCEISINKLQKLSSALNISFGYFFLSAPPEDQAELVNYRTVKNKDNKTTSRNLIDTIYDMERKQAFIKESRINDGLLPLSFVGRMTENDDYQKFTDDMRRELNLDIDWNLKVNDAFSFFRNRISNNGVSVFKNGVVATNNKRILSVDEFRAFVLVDKYAPLIFINGNDDITAQLFSLCHETAHIWLGISELLNTYGNESIANKQKIERLCNRVASELLIPKSNIKNLFNDDYSLNSIINIARKLKVSSQAVLIALKQNDFLTTQQFDELYLQVLAQSEIPERNMQRKSRGDYYRTVLKRLDNNFITLVNNKAAAGDILYTQAFNLLNVKSGTTYDKIIKKQSRYFDSIFAIT